MPSHHLYLANETQMIGLAPKHTAVQNGMAENFVKTMKYD